MNGSTHTHRGCLSREYAGLGSLDNATAFQTKDMHHLTSQGSPPGAHPKPPSKFLQQAMKSTAWATLTEAVVPKMDRHSSAQNVKRVSTSPHGSPTNDPSGCCSDATSVHKQVLRQVRAYVCSNPTSADMQAWSVCGDACSDATFAHKQVQVA